MDENTNDVSMNGENEDQELEQLAAEVNAEIERDIAEYEAEQQTEQPTEPTPPPSQKKKKERELPDWMVDKVTVNELKFCKYIVEKHPLKCISGRFFDYNSTHVFLPLRTTL